MTKSKAKGGKIGENVRGQNFNQKQKPMLSLKILVKNMQKY